MSGTIADLVIARSADTNRALVFEGREYTWSEVVQEARARAQWMGSLDEPRHIGVLLDNVPEFVFQLLGAALANAVIVGLNKTRRGEQLARDVRHTDCKAVVTDEDLVGLELGGAEIVDPQLLSQLRINDSGPTSGGSRPEDLYLLIFTSGSTGHPKAVKVTQGRAFNTGTRLPFQSTDILYSAMPLFHGNALFSNLIPALRSGATIVLKRKFSARDFIDDVRAHGCTFFNTVGRAIAHINATPAGPADRDHSLKFVLGPETSEADKAAFTARFGVPVFDGYGSSENAVILHPTTKARHPGPLGVAPEGTDIAVVDPATGRECPRAQFDEETHELLNAGEAIGEIVGRDAASRFEGYYKDPDSEQQRLRLGWYWSGDLAYRDEDGVFYFAGRSGDWLRVDSENFTAAPIERILALAPGVAGVAVYPVPDVRSGDQVMAAVEMLPGHEFDPDVFVQFLVTHPDLSPKWAPAYIRLVDALPTTGTDKLDKKPLRAEAWRTRDPMWRRPPRESRYVPMTAEDKTRLEADLAANGRAHMVGVTE